MCRGWDLNYDFLERKIYWSETLNLSREEVDAKRMRIRNWLGDIDKIRGGHLHNLLPRIFLKGVLV